MSELRLDEVTKRYRSGGEQVCAAQDVSLTVAVGELVALYGPSGAGKSTLLLLAAALLAPDSGAVWFEGRDLSTLSEAARVMYLRRQVGFVYQSFHLMAEVSALDNTALKLIADGMSLRKARRVAEPLLHRVGLGDRLDHTPDQLSGGERQRVAVARALVNGPALILADEPTGSLDTKRGVEILSLLASTCRETGAAGLLVTHDPQAAAIADRVHVLRDGVLLAAPPLDADRPGRETPVTSLRP